MAHRTPESELPFAEKFSQRRPRRQRKAPVERAGRRERARSLDKLHLELGRLYDRLRFAETPDERNQLTYELVICWDAIDELTNSYNDEDERDATEFSELES